MRFSTALALSVVPAVVLAADHTVTVGDKGMLMFEPNTLVAAAGDNIHFEFRAKNHSVTQSTFAAPCEKAMFNGSAGTSSGFMAIPQNSTLSPGQFPTWSITLKDTSALWFHCGQKTPVNHCQMGMVFSINPTADKSADAYLNAAKASTDNSTDPAAASGGATPSGGASTPSSGDAGSSSATSASSPSDSAAAASATGSGVAPSGVVGTSGAANVGGTSAADQSTPTSGASTTVLKRGAAGLFTVAAAVCAVLL